MTCLHLRNPLFFDYCDANFVPLNYLDKSDMIEYNAHSECVAETCEACDPGSFCGGSLFISVRI